MKSTDAHKQEPTRANRSNQPFFSAKSETAFFSPGQSVQRDPFFQTSNASPTTPIQAKLTVGAVGDQYEQEADRVAAEVVDRINNPSVQQGSDAQSIQRMGQEEDEVQMKRSPDAIQRAGEEKEDLQMKPITETIQRIGNKEEDLQMTPMVQRVGAEGGSVSADLEGEINSARGGGQRLAPQLQAQMGQAMGADFSGVRVHTDGRADQLNRSIQAKAFTTGQDVFFRQGAYEPGSQDGKELIAHELTHVVQQNGGVVQRKYDITATDEEREALTRHAEVVMHQPRALEWVEKLDEVYKYIEKVRLVLEEDEDVAALAESEAAVDRQAAVLDALTIAFEPLPPFHEGRNLRSNAPGGKLGSKRKKEEGAESEDAPQPKAQRPETKQDKALEIQGATIALGRLGTQLKALFPLSTGGFSAKGRAHEMEVSEMEVDGTHEDKTWFEGVQLGGEPLVNSKKVYKKNRNVDEVSSDAVYPADLRDGTNEERLGALEERLTSVEANQAFTWLRAPIPKDRGEGQVASMGGTNASGYAQLAGIEGWRAKRWEWLHIRAASLGGWTDGRNLVVGTRDANTHMMPFEAHIRLLAKLAGEKPAEYTGVRVGFIASGKDASAGHKYSSITLTWQMIKAGTAGGDVIAPEGKAVFKPLESGSSISKTEIEIIERALKEQRHGEAEEVEETEEAEVDEE